MPKYDTKKLLVKQAVHQLRATSACLCQTRRTQAGDANNGFPTTGVSRCHEDVRCWSTLGPQLMVEIGDVKRFHSKKAFVAYANIDVPPNDSGNITVSHRGMSKVGSSSLRRTIFLVMTVYL